MLKGFRTYEKEKLKELYSDQCSPCMLGHPECKGDIEKAEKLLSFKPQYTLTQALHETLNWYIKQGWF